MAVNKKEFADRMAENGGTTKKAAYQAVETFIETLMEFLGEGEAVRLKNFGKFELKNMKEREARNPKTGEKCMVPQHMRVKFTPSETLADKILDE